jgi:hypothetical protein
MRQKNAGKQTIISINFTLTVSSALLLVKLHPAPQNAAAAAAAAHKHGPAIAARTERCIVTVAQQLITRSSDKKQEVIHTVISVE